MEKKMETIGIIGLYCILFTPPVPFSPFHFGASLLKLNMRKKGTFIVNGLLGNLVKFRFRV